MGLENEPGKEPVTTSPSAWTPCSSSRRRIPWAAGACAVGLAGSLIGVRVFSAAAGVLVSRWHVLIVLASWSVAFVVAAAGLIRMPVRLALPTLAVGAVALCAVAVAGRPQLSDDLYRYAWDGRVQAAGIDPYRYPPDDPALARLRDRWLWPDEDTCRAIQRSPGCTRLNRPDARTIYPPLAQWWFSLLHATGLSRLHERGLQAAAAGLHLALTALIVAALRGLGRDPRLAVLYAWCPFAIVESAGDAHVEPLAALAAVGVVWASARGRSWLAGLLLGAGTAIKLLPALLAPVALRRRPIRVGLAAVAVVVLSYLPHVLAVGPQVLGYLPDYLQEENYLTGSRFLLLGLVGLSGPAARWAAGAILVAAAMWTLGRRRTVPPTRLAVQFVGIAFLVLTPVQPWYAVLLIALAALDGAGEWLAVAAAGYPLYLAAVLDADTVAVGRASYGAALALVATVGLVRAARARPRNRSA